jgi:hypothetical protein
MRLPFGFFLFVATLIALPLPCRGSEALRKAWMAKTKLEQAKEKAKLESLLGDELDQEREERQRFLHSQIKVAQGEFRTALDAELTAFEPWERPLVEALRRGSKSPTPEKKPALEFLREAFPQAHEWSPLEWRFVAEWFGVATQETFLRESFAAREWKPKSGSATQKLKILWVVDPYRKLLDPTQAQHPAQAESERLARLGHEVKILELTAFDRVEDQVEELRNLFLAQHEEPFLLVSSGDASAIIYRTLDTYSGLRRNAKIQAWINLDGALYGKAPAGGRKLASEPAVAAMPSERLTTAARRQMMVLYAQSIERRPPLGEGFKIVNFVSGKLRGRKGGNLRTAIVQGGTTWISDRDVFGRMEEVLSAALEN